MKRLVLLSGGLDSATLLAYLLAKNDKSQIVALSFDYDQRHVRELVSARALVKHYGIAHEIVDLTDVLMGGALRGEGEVPHGHYNDETMKQTVVPARNLVMLSVAANRAAVLHADSIAIAVHAGDHFIYPDCRPEFVVSAGETISLSLDAGVKLFAPFSHMDKAAIVKLGVQRGMPFEMTWTCYEGRERPCGKCGACVERAEAFMEAGTNDPLIYGASDDKT